MSASDYMTQAVEGDMRGWQDVIAVAAASLQCIFTKIPSGEAEVANATRRIQYMVGPPKTALKVIKPESTFIEKLRTTLFPSRASGAVPEEALPVIAWPAATRPVQDPTELNCTHLSRKKYFGLEDWDDDNALSGTQPSAPVGLLFAEDAKTIHEFLSSTCGDMCYRRDLTFPSTDLGLLIVAATDMGQILRSASNALRVGRSADNEALKEAVRDAELILGGLEGSVAVAQKFCPKASERTWAALGTIGRTAAEGSKPSDLGPSDLGKSPQ